MTNMRWDFAVLEDERKYLVVDNTLVELELGIFVIVFRVRIGLVCRLSTSKLRITELKWLSEWAHRAEHAYDWKICEERATTVSGAVANLAVLPAGSHDPGMHLAPPSNHPLVEPHDIRHQTVRDRIVGVWRWESRL